MKPCEQGRQLFSEERLPRPQFLALEKRKDGNDVASVDIEGRAIERREWRDHLLDLVRQEPKKCVLPSHARGIGAFYPHDELSSPEDSASRVREKALEARGNSHPIAIGDGFGFWFKP